MPFCRKCGAELDRDAKFCPSCGTSVTPPAVRPERRRKERKPISTLAILLIVLLVVAVVIAALAGLVFLPVRTVDVGPLRHTVPYETGVNTLNLDFTADVASVNIAFENIMDFQGRLAISLEASATARVGIFGSSDVFGSRWFSSSDTKVGNVVTVTSEVDVADGGWPGYSSVNVTCDILIDPSMKTRLNIRTGTGGVVLETRAGVTLNSLSLEATTGGVEVRLVEDVVVAGDVSVKTTTGGVEFSWDNVIVTQDVLVNATTVTGGVDVDVKQDEELLGNVTLNAEATTGGVDFAMEIRGDVGAKIESTVTTGGIEIIRQVRFSGTTSLLQSGNYPASSNFDTSLKTTTGGIDIDAKYTP